MFALKVLSGNQSGKVYHLSSTENSIGRSKDCDIFIPNKNISKQHAKIIVDRDRLVFTDLNSTNGSFVNGVKVEVTLIKLGDKITLFDTLMELIEDKSTSLPGSSSESIETDSAPSFGNPVENQIQKIDSYLEKAALDPFYNLLTKVDFKWVQALFLGLVIFATALLSTVPLMNIIQESVETESKNRARSLAKLIATVNLEPLRNKNYSAASVRLGFQEPGVKKALLIRQDTGEIIKPDLMQRQFLKGPVEGKVNSYRKFTDRPHHTFKADKNTIISMYPIKFYNPENGLEATQFYSVVVYNAKVLSLGNSQTLSLFIQTLFLALLFGLVVFYFLYKISVYPFKKLNSDLAESLSSGDPQLSTSIQLPSLQEIYVSAGSLLNRSTQNASDANTHVEADRNLEVQNLSHLIGYACIFISSADESVLDYNPYFEELTNLYDIKGQKLSDLSDQALQQNLQDLVDRCRLDPDSIVENDFEFSGVPYLIKTQAIYGNQDVAYFVCALVPNEVEA